MKKLVCGKHLLLAFMCVLCSSMSALAFNVGDYVYTKVGKYRITGSENLVANGEFTDGSTEGWMATDEVNYPLESVFAPVEHGGVQVLPGQTALTAGMHQAVRIWAGGTYVVTFKVKGATAGFTDHDMAGDATNYINAYYNTDGALASVDNTTLPFGENGVNGGYQFDFGADGFTEVCFAVNAPMHGNIMFDFRGLADGLMIKDVQCYVAEEVYDDRIAVNRIAYFNKYLADGDFDGKEHYAELQECIDAVNDGIAANADPATMATHMENLEGCWTLFVEANFSNVLNLIPTTDGSANTGNNSANWMNWKLHMNKCNSEYASRGKAPWTWSTDRWSHKCKSNIVENNPLQIQWQRKADGDWNNIATLTATLTPGTYYWGVSGQGGMMTLNKGSWVRSWANENAATQLFFNGDTTEVFILNAARTEDYVYRFELTEEREITLGIICNTNTVETDGFDVAFYNPVLYKVLGEGLSPEEDAFLGAVQFQLEDLIEQLAATREHLYNNTTPWGKNALRQSYTAIDSLYYIWSGMSEDEIIDCYWNELYLPDVIKSNGVQQLVDDVSIYLKLNMPVTDMSVAIAAAWETLNKRIYSSSSKKDEYEALIVASEDLYEAMLKSEYSEENAAVLIAQKASLEAMAEEFKAAVNATTIVDIDFGTQDNPVQIEESQDWETGMYSYYITGAKGTMTFTDVLGSYCYTLGWAHDVTDETTGEVSTVIDSVGMLRVGNSEATVVVPAAPVVEAGGILNIQFDYYYGNLSGRKAGYKVLSAEGDTICGLFCSKYSRNDDLNTFGVDYNGMINAVGSSRESNLAIAAASNKTHFDIVLDYGTKTMFCTTSSSLGTVTTEIFDLPESVPTKFVLYSNYNNADRRCWFDNLKIQNISAEGATPSDPITPEPILPNGYVYTKVGKYITTGENLVNNGQFADGSIEGWMATDEVNYPLEGVFAPVEDGGVQVLPGQTALAAGMYQAVRIDAGGTYVVSFKVKGATAGFTDHDMTGAATNYINAYYNTDGALASVDNTNLLFGENGVNGGYQFDFGAEDFTEVYFAVNAPMEGNIMIDFRGLAEGLIIKDVECYAAEEVYDDRIANNRIAYFNKYLTEGDFEGREYYDEFKDYVKAVEDAIAANASPADMATHMENLEGCWILFVEANFSNVLNLIPTTDGSANTGNNSANWMNWTAKWNKLSNDYNGKAPWTWTTDRWGHKTAAVNTPMAIQWMRGAGANSNWNNVATLTATLSPGIYYWGVSGQGGMFTLNKNRWARSWADECAETKLFFNGDTVLVGILNAARNEDYVVQFKLEEEKEITLGIICNNVSSSANAGFDVQFFSPILYKVNVEESLAMGDVNSDEQHTMSDVVMQVNAVLGIAQENYNADVADMNSDGSITMADVVLVLRLVLGYDSVAAARSAVRTAPVPVLSAGDMIAVNANRMVLPINLNNDEAYSAFQLDVVLPEGVKLAEATLTNRAKSNHAIAWNTLADGTTRVVAYAMNNATFKGSEGALLNLVLETSDDLAADGMIALKGGLFTAVNGTEDSSADLNVMMRSETTGIRSIYGVVQVSGAEDAVIVESNDICVVNVYALTGQMVRKVTVHEGKNVIDLPKGVYIVNNQRVIVK